MCPLSLSSHLTLNLRYAAALHSLTPSFLSHHPDLSTLRDPVHSRLILAVHRITNTGKAHNHKMEDPTRGPTSRYVPLYLIFVFGARAPCDGAYSQWSGDANLILLGSGIRNFTVSVTVRIASEEANLRRERAYLNKLNLALVQVRDHTSLLFSFNMIYRTEYPLCRSSNRSGRTTGQNLCLNSWNRPKLACRYAKTTWSSYGFYRKRFSTTLRSK